MTTLNPLFAIEVTSAQIGAGKVVDFIPRSEKAWIPLPPNARPFDQFCEFTVSGDSLAGHGISDGDLLTCRKNFELSEIKPSKVCIIYIHPTGELTAKFLRINNDGTITVIAANPKYKPKTYFADEVQILALADEHRRTI